MKLIKNTGSDRVIDELRQTLAPPSSLDLASPAFSLFAFAELRDLLEKLDACRVVLPATNWGRPWTDRLRHGPRLSESPSTPLARPRMCRLD